VSAYRLQDDPRDDRIVAWLLAGDIGLSAPGETLKTPPIVGGAREKPSVYIRRSAVRISLGAS